MFAVTVENSNVRSSSSPIEIALLAVFPEIVEFTIDIPGPTSITRIPVLSTNVDPEMVTVPPKECWTPAVRTPVAPEFEFPEIVESNTIKNAESSTLERAIAPAVFPDDVVLPLTSVRSIVSCPAPPIATPAPLSISPPGAPTLFEITESEIVLITVESTMCTPPVMPVLASTIELIIVTEAPSTATPPPSPVAVLPSITESSIRTAAELETSTPPPLPVVSPSRITTPRRVAFAALFTSNTRELPWPETVTAPLPSTSTSSANVNWPKNKLIVPPAENWITSGEPETPAEHSPAIAPEETFVFADVTASRSVHLPSLPSTTSIPELTVIVVPADAGPTNNNIALATTPAANTSRPNRSRILQPPVKGSRPGAPLTVVATEHPDGSIGETRAAH